MDYTLSLEIQYDFPRPTGGGRQLLRITPQQNAQQSLTQFQVDISPRPSEQSVFTDFFGTEVIEVVLPGGIKNFSIKMRAKVQRHAAMPQFDVSPDLQHLRDEILSMRDLGPHSPHHYLAPTPSIPRLGEIADFATRVSHKARTSREIIEALGRAVYHHMTFDAKATEVHTPIQESFTARRGVCQDYAQIMICALRSLAIPAAYAAGYLRTLPPEGQPRLQGADAMHAWVRAWAGAEMGWLDFDPTNNCWVAEDHILVGFGRDYADAAPVTGSLILEGGQSGRHAVDISGA